MPNHPDANQQPEKARGWRPSLVAVVAFALFGPVIAYAGTAGLLNSSAPKEPLLPEVMPLPDRVKVNWSYPSPDGAYAAARVDGHGSWVALREKGAPGASAETVAYTSWQTGAFSGIDNIEWTGPRTLCITAWNELATRPWRDVHIEVRVRQDAAELTP